MKDPRRYLSFAPWESFDAPASNATDELGAPIALARRGERLVDLQEA